jgi:hypothetical protein
MTADGTLAAATRRLVEWTLAKHRGHKVKAAAELGMSFKTLYNWLDRWEADDRRRRQRGEEVPMVAQDMTCVCGGLRLTADGPCLACGSLVAVVAPDPDPDPAWYDRDDGVPLFDLGDPGA